MQYPELYQHIQEARERLQEYFKDVPERSPANSIAASHAAWNAHEPAILTAFKRIKSLTHKVKHAEYEWVRKVTREIQIELDEIRVKLAEGALGSPEE
jgi:hypothetical protein